MRALILVAAAALTLAACKNNDQSDNTQNVDENLTAENIVSNDVTAHRRRDRRCRQTWRPNPR